MISSTCGLFVMKEFDIPIKSQAQPIYIVPFGDVHFGSPNCAVDEWQKFCKKYKGRDDCYFLGMGDYQDFLAGKERRAFRDANIHDSTDSTIDKLARDTNRDFQKTIEWMKGRLIGMHEGNHYYQYSDGSTTTTHMCNEMGCHYLGVTSIVRINFRTRHNEYATMEIFGHHGRGTGRRAGSMFNPLEDMRKTLDTALIYVMGHSHKLGSMPQVRLRAVKRGGVFRMEQQSLVLVRSGGYLRGYVPGERSYIADAQMEPVPLGSPEIEVYVRRVMKDGVKSMRVDVKGKS